MTLISTLPRCRSALLAGLVIFGLLPAGTEAAGPPTVSARHTPLRAAVGDRIIVKWREQGVAAIQIDALPARTARLRAMSGLALRSVRSIRSRLDVVSLGAPVDADGMRWALARLQADPSVEYAEPDEPRYIAALPSDPRFVAGTDTLGDWRGQWYLGAPSVDTPAAIDAITAWDSGRGDNMIVAVIDTGVRLDHPDLAGQLLDGRDFVCHDDLNLSCTAAGASLTLKANDGDGWDADPSDPGDWLSAADLARSDNFFAGCGGGVNHDEPYDSSWHGTRVAGLIAAVTDNAIGIASVAPHAKIVPVRAIGKCMGYTSDVVAAMYWAAGIGDSSTGTLPAIANHAHIVNLSFGSRSTCSQSEQTAITALVNAGVVVIAAAGNDGGPIGAPANCAGVLAVAGIRHIGTKVGYSNVSSTVAAISISAPAGNCVNILASQPCLYSIETLTNEGITAPVMSNALTSYTYALFNPGYPGNHLNAGNVGTSFSAPIVSGVAALMASLNGELTVTELIQRMKLAATPFPTPVTAPAGGTCHVAALTKDSSGIYNDVQDSDCQCTTATCGAGMLNAKAAIAQALRPIAIITSSSTSASIGQRISLDGSASLAATGHHIAAYRWSSSPSVSIANAGSAMAEIVFPALRPITVSLTVTDEAGRQDTVSETIEAALGGSGGGAFGLELLALALILGGRLLLRN